MPAELESVENILNKLLDFHNSNGVQWPPMAKATKKPVKIQLRPTDDDFAIIQAGMRKHGLDMSQILRMALRRLAEAEGFRAS